MKRFSVFFMLLFLCFSISAKNPFYICTSSDSDYFPHLINLINSLHKYNFDELGEIAVFDLGFTQNQICELKTIKKVSVHDVERTHPDLLKHFRVNNRGKKVRGCYAWKPVVMKQGLDLFPYFLYMDAGLMILKPVDGLFEHIWEHGYLLAGCGHSIAWMTPKHVIEMFDLESEERKWILDESTEGCAGGFMGLSREMWDSFLAPMYDFAHDLKHFVDDGTTPNGFGTGRHDQTLFSVLARILNLDIPSWHDQAKIELGGRWASCLCRDIVIRTHHVLDVSKFPKKIRSNIKYEESV